MGNGGVNRWKKERPQRKIKGFSQIRFGPCKYVYRTIEEHDTHLPIYIIENTEGKVASQYV